MYLQASGKLADSADMDIFADEHMVEMNRKSSPRMGGARKQTRLRSPSPFPSRNATPGSGPAPSLSNSTPAVAGDGQAEKAAVEKKPLHKDTSLPVVKESQNSVSMVDNSIALKQQTPEEVKEVHISASHPRPEPFKSSSLPEEKSNNSGISASKAVSISKVNSSRKRERTPSPTPYPNPKRSLLASDGLPSSKLTSTLQILRGVSSGNHVKSPSPILGGGNVGNPSASRLLSEEMQKQQGQENAKLKVLIVKEVRKHGKSECIINPILTPHCSSGSTVFMGLE